jgi:hypothetical protein
LPSISRFSYWPILFRVFHQYQYCLLGEIRNTAWFQYGGS